MRSFIIPQTSLILLLFLLINCTEENIPEPEISINLPENGDTIYSELRLSYEIINKPSKLLRLEHYINDKIVKTYDDYDSIHVDITDLALNTKYETYLSLITGEGSFYNSNVVEFFSGETDTIPNTFKITEKADSIVFTDFVIDYKSNVPNEIQRVEIYIDDNFYKSFQPSNPLLVLINSFEKGSEHSYFIHAVFNDGSVLTSSTYNFIIGDVNAPTLNVDALDPDLISLSWNNNSLTEEGYRVYRHTINLSDTTLLADLDPDITVYEDNTVKKEDTGYLYSVEAYYKNVTGRSNKINVEFKENWFGLKDTYNIYGDMRTGNIAISNDGILVGVSDYEPGGNNIALLNLNTRTFSKLAGHEDRAYCVLFNHSGDKLFTTGADGYLRVWDVNTLNQTSSFRTSASIYTIDFSPNEDSLAIGGSYTNISILLVNDNWKVVQTFQYSSTLRSVLFSSDNKYILYAGNDDIIRLWDIQNAAVVKIYKGHTGHIGSAIFNSDESIIISSSYEDGTIRQWNVATEQNIKKYQHDANIRNIKLMEDNIVVFGDYAGKINFLNLSTNNIIQSIELTDPIYSVDYSLTTKTVVALNNKGDVLQLEISPNWAIIN